MSIQAGQTYKITSVKAGTALDLASNDGYNVVGWNSHDAPQQRWTFEEFHGRWSLRNGLNNKYLGIEGDAKDGTKVIGVSFPFLWDIYYEGDPNVIRLFVPGAPWPGQNIELFEGNPQPGTKVNLWSKSDGAHQLWKIEKLA